MPINFFAPLALVICGLLGSNSAQASRAYTAYASRIVDGDTLWVKPERGGAPRKLRLQGIDAPEICQSGGTAAREALRALVDGQKLTVRVSHKDDYGRGLARLEASGQDVAATLVRQGQAWSYRWRNSLGPYAAQEAQARHDRIGLFAQPNPELPHDFRRSFGSCYKQQH